MLALTELSERSMLEDDVEREFELVLRTGSRSSRLDDERDRLILDV